MFSSEFAIFVGYFCLSLSPGGVILEWVFLVGRLKRNLFFHSYMPRKSKFTKLCSLVVILYMDHPKDHSLFGLGLPGI